MSTTPNSKVASLHATPKETRQPTAMSELSLDLEAEKVRSFVAEGDEFVGDLHCQFGVRVAGIVRGAIACAAGAVVIERTAQVSGSITGREKIFIDGTINGQGVEGGETVKISSPGLIALFNHAVVNADIEYGKLATYDDMTHNGSSKKMTAS